MKATKTRLLLIGSTEGSTHVKNYYNLIADYFDEIIIVSTKEVDYCKSYAIDFGLRNPFKILSGVKKLRKIINDFKPSIIHVHQANSYGYITALANKGKYKQILTTWGSDVLLVPQQGWFLKQVVKKSLKSADFITADASFMADAIHNLIGNVQVTIANFGIDIDQMPDEKVKKEKIIYSNRLHNPLYNIDKIIIESARFLEKNKDWKLVVGANGTLTENLKILSEDLISEDQVEFIGFVSSDLNRANYLKAQIYVSIPSSDGTAISLLEAMAYGCIPVVSNLPANKEWIKHGVNGIVLDGISIEEGINLAIKLNVSNLVQTNQEIIRNRASKQANKLIFEGIYTQALND
jgi:glycosyltransferase involved in cell wall biosynthesis